MRHKTHLLAGVVVGLGLIHQGGPPVILAATVAGALWPDLDHPQSHIAQALPPLALVARLGRHRGAWHSLAAAGAWGYAVAALVGLEAGAAFAAGYVAHLLLDCMTPAGVAAAWPWGARVRGIIPTGSRGDDLMLAGLALYLLLNFWPPQL